MGPAIDPETFLFATGNPRNFFIVGLAIHESFCLRPAIHEILFIVGPAIYESFCLRPAIHEMLLRDQRSMEFIYCRTSNRNVLYFVRPTIHKCFILQNRRFTKSFVLWKQQSTIYCIAGLAIHEWIYYRAAGDQVFSTLQLKHKSFLSS